MIVTLLLGGESKAQLVQLLWRLFFLRRGFLARRLRDPLPMFLLAEIFAQGCEFSFQFANAFVRDLDLLPQCGFLRLEIVDLARSFFQFALEQRDFSSGRRLREIGRSMFST